MKLRALAALILSLLPSFAALATTTDSSYESIRNRRLENEFRLWKEARAAEPNKWSFIKSVEKDPANASIWTVKLDGATLQVTFPAKYPFEAFRVKVVEGSDSMEPALRHFSWRNYVHTPWNLTYKVAYYFHK